MVSRAYQKENTEATASSPSWNWGQRGASRFCKKRAFNKTMRPSAFLWKRGRRRRQQKGGIFTDHNILVLASVISLVVSGLVSHLLLGLNNLNDIGASTHDDPKLSLNLHHGLLRTTPHHEARSTSKEGSSRTSNNLVFFAQALENAPVRRLSGACSDNNCDAAGTESCYDISGGGYVCVCKNHAIGKHCDSCETNYYTGSAAYYSIYTHSDTIFSTTYWIMFRL